MPSALPVANRQGGQPPGTATNELKRRRREPLERETGVSRAGATYSVVEVRYRLAR